MERADLEDKFKGALVGTFVGDAFGRPFEGRRRRSPIRREEIGVFAPGTAAYSDDTEMTIATAESLIRSRGFDQDDMARAFLENFHRERGYGRGTKAVFRLWRQGVSVAEAAEMVFEGGSFGNGAAMRMAPVGCLYFDRPGELLRIARQAALLTHAHRLGWSGAVVQAAAVALAVESMPSRDLDPAGFLERLTGFVPSEADDYARLLEAARDLLRTASDDPFAVVGFLGNDSTATGSVCTAVYAFLKHPRSFSEAVLYAVALGGDADTIGAMTGAIAGAYHGMSAIPCRWLEMLENGSKGLDHVVRLGAELFGLWQSTRNATAFVQTNPASSPLP